MKWKQDHDNEYYIEHFYKEVLDELDVNKIYEELKFLSEEKDCVLLCYERVGDFCHRHLVANWLSNNLNIEVREW